MIYRQKPLIYKKPMEYRLLLIKQLIQWCAGISQGPTKKLRYQKNPVPLRNSPYFTTLCF